MIRLVIAFALLFALPAALPARAEQVVVGLSQNRVSITANFDGSEILIFGAVKRTAPPPPGGPMQVVITLSGPSQTVTVRRKDRRFGIWINTDAVEVDRAPSYYAVATSGPLHEVISHTEDLRHRVSIPYAIRLVGARTAGALRFSEALIRIRQNKGLYLTEEGAVAIHDDTLFNTAITMPSNLVEGVYSARILLTRDGRVVDEFTTDINVQKVGLERFLYWLAYSHAWLYGLLSLVIAVAAGWAAAAGFRYLKS